MKRTALILATAMAGTLSAQTAPDPASKPRTMHWEHKVAVAGAPQEATIGFMAAEGAVGFAGSAIKSAPFSATIENTFTQTLADGTRIERKSSSKTARDSEGRTRMEHRPAAASPVPVELPTTTIIHDPVAKQTIILNDKDKTASIMKMPDMTAMRSKMAGVGGVRMRSPMPAGAVAATEAAPAVVEDVVIERKIERAGPGAPAIAAFPPSDVMFTTAVPAQGATMGHHQVMIFDRGDDKSKTEQLGTQTISGVACNATRSTHTIAAGQIGNDRPIEIVSETCFSDELKTVVSSRTNDPMHGETSMRLASVSRAEPAKSLFEVPAGYTTKEGPQPMMFERKILERKPAP